MTKIVIYGATAIAKVLSENIKENVEIVAYAVDEGYESNTNVVGEKKLILTNDIPLLEFDYVVIAFSRIDDGIKKLLSVGIQRDKIVGFTYCGNNLTYDNNKYQIMIDNKWKEEINYSALNMLFKIKPPRFYSCTFSNAEKQIDDCGIIESDYVREATLKLISDEIKRKKVAGSVAELGVYRGDFSKKINVLFPDRKLYLFDTFEGFDERDVSLLIDKSENFGAFRDTDVEYVISKMRFPNNCVVKKGYFPDTFDIFDETFAFVSLDADLYAPILSGLELFYPRLNKGGYIMVHDYNGLEYEGAMNAVINYCDANEISYVPIPDMAGTVVITK